MQFVEGSKGFLGIDDPQFTDYDKSRIAVQVLPYEHTSSYILGSAQGPAAILDASSYVEFYDEELSTDLEFLLKRRSILKT